MALSPKLLSALQKIAETQQAGFERVGARQAQRQEETSTDRLARALESIGQMNAFQGPKGDKGDTPRRGIDYFTANDVAIFLEEATPVKNKDYFDGDTGPRGERGEQGPEGKIGPVGPEGIANMAEVDHEISEAMNEHKKQYDHALLHKSTTIGDFEVDTASLQEGEYLQVKGKKLVGVKIQMPDYNGLRNYVTSQGVSNFRSYPVTADTTIESMAIYVVNADAGDITITLPSAAGRENFWFEIIRIDSSANTVTVVPTGSELLNDMTSYIMQQWTDLRIFAYNGGYLIRSAG